MAYLADTNVVLRWALQSDPLYPAIRRVIFDLQAKGEIVFATAQNLVELRALATRPLSANGLGMSTAEAGGLARTIEALFPLLPETPGIYPRWRTLVDTYDIMGRQVYDARLVAVMLEHGTLNPADFRRFSEITVVEPQRLAGSP
jgi:predicted nucleic acid-binding protein